MAPRHARILALGALVLLLKTLSEIAIPYPSDTTSDTADVKVYSNAPASNSAHEAANTILTTPPEAIETGRKFCHHRRDEQDIPPAPLPQADGYPPDTATSGKSTTSGIDSVDFSDSGSVPISTLAAPHDTSSARNACKALSRQRLRIRDFGKVIEYVNGAVGIGAQALSQAVNARVQIAGGIVNGAVSMANKDNPPQSSPTPSPLPSPSPSTPMATSTSAVAPATTTSPLPEQGTTHVSPTGGAGSSTGTQCAKSNIDWKGSLGSVANTQVTNNDNDGSGASGEFDGIDTGNGDENGALNEPGTSTADGDTNDGSEEITTKPEKDVASDPEKTAVSGADEAALGETEDSSDGNSDDLSANEANIGGGDQSGDSPAVPTYDDDSAQTAGQSSGEQVQRLCKRAPGPGGFGAIFGRVFGPVLRQTIRGGAKDAIVAQLAPGSAASLAATSSTTTLSSAITAPATSSAMTLLSTISQSTSAAPAPTDTLPVDEGMSLDQGGSTLPVERKGSLGTENSLSAVTTDSTDGANNPSRTDLLLQSAQNPAADSDTRDGSGDGGVVHESGEPMANFQEETMASEEKFPVNNELDDSMRGNSKETTIYSAGEGALNPSDGAADSDSTGNDADASEKPTSGESNNGVTSKSGKALTSNVIKAPTDELKEFTPTSPRKMPRSTAMSNNKYETESQCDFTANELKRRTAEATFPTTLIIRMRLDGRSAQTTGIDDDITAPPSSPVAADISNDSRIPIITTTGLQRGEELPSQTSQPITTTMTVAWAPGQAANAVEAMIEGYPADGPPKTVVVNGGPTTPLISAQVSTRHLMARTFSSGEPSQTTSPTATPIASAASWTTSIIATWAPGNASDALEAMNEHYASDGPPKSIVVSAAVSPSISLQGPPTSLLARTLSSGEQSDTLGQFATQTSSTTGETATMNMPPELTATIHDPHIASSNPPAAGASIMLEPNTIATATNAMESPSDIDSAAQRSRKPRGTTQESEPQSHSGDEMEDDVVGSYSRIYTSSDNSSSEDLPQDTTAPSSTNQSQHLAKRHPQQDGHLTEQLSNVFKSELKKRSSRYCSRDPPIGNDQGSQGVRRAATPIPPGRQISGMAQRVTTWPHRVAARVLSPTRLRTYRPSIPDNVPEDGASGSHGPSADDSRDDEFVSGCRQNRLGAGAYMRHNAHQYAEHGFPLVTTALQRDTPQNAPDPQVPLQTQALPGDENLNPARAQMAPPIRPIRSPADSDSFLDEATRLTNERAMEMWRIRNQRSRPCAAPTGNDESPSSSQFAGSSTTAVLNRESTISGLAESRRSFQEVDPQDTSSEEQDREPYDAHIGRCAGNRARPGNGGFVRGLSDPLKKRSLHADHYDSEHHSKLARRADEANELAEFSAEFSGDEHVSRDAPSVELYEARRLNKRAGGDRFKKFPPGRRRQRQQGQGSSSDQGQQVEPEAGPSSQQDQTGEAVAASEQSPPGAGPAELPYRPTQAQTAPERGDLSRGRGGIGRPAGSRLAVDEYYVGGLPPLNRQYPAPRGPQNVGERYGNPPDMVGGTPPFDGPRMRRVTDVQGPMPVDAWAQHGGARMDAPVIPPYYGPDAHGQGRPARLTEAELEDPANYGPDGKLDDEGSRKNIRESIGGSYGAPVGELRVLHPGEQEAAEGRSDKHATLARARFEDYDRARRKWSEDHDGDMSNFSSRSGSSMPPETQEHRSEPWMGGRGSDRVGTSSRSRASSLNSNSEGSRSQTGLSNPGTPRRRLSQGSAYLLGVDAGLMAEPQDLEGIGGDAETQAGKSLYQGQTGHRNSRQHSTGFRGSTRGYSGSKIFDRHGRPLEGAGKPEDDSGKDKGKEPVRDL